MAISVHDEYQRGSDAANRALDRSVLNASDLLNQARLAEETARAQEIHWLAEWNKGYADMIQEFLDEKGT